MISAMIFIVTSAKVSGSTLAPCTESRNKVKIVVFGLVLYIYLLLSHLRSGNFLHSTAWTKRLDAHRKRVGQRTVDGVKAARAITV